MGRTQRNGRTDKLAEAHDRLAAAVEALVTGDDWQAFLTMAAKLHGYSANNVLLILSQAPWASQVAGYQTWKQVGRQVRAGEKGIAILAPCRYRSVGDDNDGDDGAGQPEAQPGRIVVRGFRVVHVFDISQTDGPEIAEPARAKLLQGEAPEGLWDNLAGQIADAGYSIERGDCYGANGRTSFATRTVTVRADVDDAQAVKTLCHELAHIEMHDGSEYATGCRGRAEVEAESVAYLVCHHHGLASDEYSFAYVAGWTGGDVDTVRATAERVLATARRIIDRLGDTDPAALVAVATAA
jgi:antirestriction protein ArdC